MVLSEKTSTFLTELQAVDGWLIDDAVHITAAIMATMRKHAIVGPNFEIGVYKGRYLAALHHCAEEYYGVAQKSFGFDFFGYSDEQDPPNSFKRLFGSDKDLHILKRSSLDASPEDIIAHCGGQRPAFISIDGDHNEWPVLEDHVLCADAIMRGGVIASDDFGNSSMIGVIGGVARFFLQYNPRGLVPFAYCANKLFSCFPVYAEYYRQGIMDFCEQNPDLSCSRRFLEGRKPGIHHICLDLLGTKCLVI